MNQLASAAAEEAKIKSRFDGLLNRLESMERELASLQKPVASTPPTLREIVKRDLGEIYDSSLKRVEEMGSTEKTENGDTYSSQTQMEIMSPTAFEALPEPIPIHAKRSHPPVERTKIL